MKELHTPEKIIMDMKKSFLTKMNRITWDY